MIYVKRILLSLLGPTTIARSRHVSPRPPLEIRDHYSTNGNFRLQRHTCRFCVTPYQDTQDREVDLFKAAEKALKYVEIIR